MAIVRFILLIVILLLVLYFSFNRNSFESLKTTFQKGVVAGISDPILKTSKDMNLPDKVAKLIYSSASASASLIKVPTVGQILEAGQNLPAEVQKQLPMLFQIITNTKEEELFFKSQRSVTIPELKIENFDQEVSVQLLGFEIKDTRKSKTPWKILIFVNEPSENPVNSEGKKIEVMFKLKLESIETIVGNKDELKIEDGPSIKVSVEPGKGKGHFILKPFIILKIPSSLTQPSKFEIESNLE